MIIYKTYSSKERNVCIFKYSEIEWTLKPTWNKIRYTNKGRKYGIIDVLFQDARTAELYSATPIETEVLVLLPVFLEKNISRVSVENILLEFNVA